ncbi:MAG TPA: MATE family efflux transporter [Solimonas sp.]
MSRLSLAAFRVEARANLRLALPLILAQLSFVSMGTVDTIVAGRMGEPELAAVAVGANVWFVLFILFMGIFMACTPIVAQRVGAGRDPFVIGGFARGAAGLAAATGVVWMLVLHVLRDPALDALALAPRTRAFAEDYLFAVSWSAVPMCLCFVLRNTAEGFGLTRAPLYAGVTGAIVNAVFAFVLGFGWLGFPALGPAGCGWATVLAALAMLGVYATLYGRHPLLRGLRLFEPGGARSITRGELREILVLGGPIAAILAAEAWLFLGGALLMARFGDAVVAAHQVAINFASMTFMVPLSIGMAATVRVGHAAGAALREEIRLRGQVGMLLGAGIALLSAAVMLGLPRQIVGVYTTVESVAQMAAGFLLFAALFQVFDGIQATANGALRGIKDTRVPMLITVAAYWLVGMPAAVWLAFHTPLGPRGIWVGFIVGLAVAALGLSLRYLNKSRRLAMPDRSVHMT